MISKNKISDIRKLHSKKYRESEKMFIVEGRKSVEMLCNSDFCVDEIFATEDFLNKNHKFLLNRDVTVVSKSEMERISAMQCAPEILATVNHRNENKIPEDQPLIALDHISDPGNLGTIIRTADWFGFKHIVCSNDCVEFYNPKTIQATMGSFANVTVHHIDLAKFLERESLKRRIVGTFLDGDNLSEFAFRNDDILVIGNESNGISRQTENFVAKRITIPAYQTKTNGAESLNAAIATAIILYKWRG